jgi:hypothetical protein
MDHPRALDIALSATADSSDDVAVAALAVLRGWVSREDGTRALEALISVALDASKAGRIRLAALDGLRDLPRDLVQPILERAPTGEPGAPDEDPAALREWIETNGRTSALSALHGVIARSGAREREAPSAPARQQWLTVRGAAHAALARRSSRVALYDLREAFDSAKEPLPLDFLAAVAAIGDEAALEPLARAWAAAPEGSWWRDRVAEAAADIVRRLKLSGRHAALKRVRAKFPGFL